LKTVAIRLPSITPFLTRGEVAATVAREHRELGVRVQNEGWLAVDGSPDTYNHTVRRTIA
jgi:hypothetical protein